MLGNITRLVLLWVSLALVGCLGVACHSGPPASQHGASRYVPGTESEEPSRSREAHDQSMGSPPSFYANVADPQAKAVPEAYLGWNVAAREWLSADELMAQVAEASLICVGVSQADALGQALVKELLDQLRERAVMSGRNLMLGLTSLPYARQLALSRYQQGKLAIGEVLQTRNAEAPHSSHNIFLSWLLPQAVEKNVSVAALGPDPRLLRVVEERGLHALPRSVREQLPEMDWEDTEHRALFGLTKTSSPSRRSRHAYAAHLLRHELISHRAGQFLGPGLPAAQMILVASEADCLRPAIPDRVQRLVSARSLSVGLVSAPPDQPPPNDAGLVDLQVVVSARPSAGLQ